jgi:hypothetical protein
MLIATPKAVCGEPKEEQKLCAVCNRRPVHDDDCPYCEICCLDDVLGVLVPQG